MRIPAFTATLMLASGLFAMEKPITINPIAAPQAYFTELDNRILKQVSSVQLACTQRDRTALLHHLNQVATLLSTAEEQKDAFLKAYNEKRQAPKHPLETLSPEAECLEQVVAFKKQSKALIDIFEKTAHEEISADEWVDINALFRMFKPVTTSKRLKTDTGD